MASNCINWGLNIVLGVVDMFSGGIVEVIEIVMESVFI